MRLRMAARLVHDLSIAIAAGTTSGKQ